MEQEKEEDEGIPPPSLWYLEIEKIYDAGTRGSSMIPPELLARILPTFETPKRFSCGPPVEFIVKYDEVAQCLIPEIKKERIEDDDDVPELESSCDHHPCDHEKGKDFFNKDYWKGPDESNEEIIGDCFFMSDENE